MALKDWLDTGKCLLGLHQGDWRLEAPSGCALVQTCERCGAVNRRIEHSWLDWHYIAEQRCDLSRSCSRCAESEQRMEHQWGAWIYREDDSCEQGIRCERCSAWSDETRTAHDWEPWEYSERYRAPVHGCARCALRASYFTDQKLDQDQDSSDASAAKVRELISNDQAIEEMLRRAEQSGGSPESNSSGAETPNDDNAEARQEIIALRQFYQSQVADGQIAPERQPFLTSIMTELEELIGKPTPSLADTQIKARRVQDLFGRMQEVLLNPSRPQPVEKPPPGSHLAAITELHADLFRYVVTEMAGGILPRAEGEAAGTLLGHLRESREPLAGFPVNGDPIKLEIETLRPLAIDIRNFSLRHHLTLAQPVWPSRTVAQHPNAVFYSGGSHLGELLAQVCETRELRLLVPQPHQEPASLRWDQLRESSLAVCDFTGYKRSASLEEASPVAAAAYELGIALALGRAVIIVATESQDLPFDLDIEPIRLSNEQTDLDNLSAAVTHALYSLQRGGAGSSVQASVNYVHNQFCNHADHHVRVSANTLAAEAKGDPIRAKHLIASTLNFLGADAPQVLWPVWPGSYPDPAVKRCFHVTAFGQSWSETTRQVVKEACATRVEYIRGDQVLDPDVLRSIWDEICRATHVVVDLTGLNANVALELGIAHTLGRNVLLISQDQQPEHYFRAIAKHRIHRYALDSASSVDALKATLEKFLR